MPIVFKILQKVLVNQFYKVNAGLFMFLFFVLFGLPYNVSGFHLSLIMGFIQSQAFLGFVFLIWIVYSLKCINYILTHLQEPRSAFLFCLNNVSKTQGYFYMLYVQFMLFLPVTLYAFAAILVAIQHQKYLPAAEIAVFIFVANLLCAYIYLVTLQKKSFLKQKLWLPAVHFHLPKPLFLIPLYHLWHSQKQMLFVSKLFSLLLLYGFIHLYEPDHYDIRPLQLCLLLVTAAQTAIVYQVRVFEEEYVAFSRNLPVTTVVRFMSIVAMYAILMLPEGLLLWNGFPLHFHLSDYPQLIVMIIALLCAFHVTLLLEDTEMEPFIKIVFAIIAACFFILLYNPGVLFPAGILLISFALFHSYYYDFEKKYNTGK